MNSRNYLVSLNLFLGRVDLITFSSRLQSERKKEPQILHPNLSSHLSVHASNLNHSIDLKKGWDAFGPEPIWSPDFRSPTSCPPGQKIPMKSIPLDKWSPANLVPLDKWSPTQFGPHIYVSPQPVPLDKRNILGTICLGGPNWLGTLCPGGPNCLGTICPRGPNF